MSLLVWDRVKLSIRDQTRLNLDPAYPMLIFVLTTFVAAIDLAPKPPAQSGEIFAWGGKPSGTPSELDFTKVRGGGAHALGLRKNGRIVAWGPDGAGQVSGAPPGIGFLDIEAGFLHSLAVSSTGEIYAWGDDRFTQVSGAPTSHDFVQVAAGEWHSLGLRSDGTLVSWGEDGFGVVTSTPSGGGFVQVSAGRTHSLALRSDGSIVAWGRDSSGQVSGAPSGTGFLQVSAGFAHSLAIANDGSIVAWGKNNGGQVSNAPSGIGFTSVDGGFVHSIALHSDGSLVSWGSNASNVISNTPPGDSFVAIDAGLYNDSYAISTPLDSDADGLPDELEDSNGNGVQDRGETDPYDQDSDDDGLSDGEEAQSGLVDPRWHEFTPGVFYRAAPEATWHQSNDSARSQGAELVSIQTASEAIWLFETFGRTTESAWIGLNDFGGSFMWSDGSALTFSNWGPGEPSGSVVASYIGGIAFPEPGAWYTETAGASARRSLWKLPSLTAPIAYSDPLNWDTDGDGLSDGLELGLTTITWDGDLDGDGNPDVGGTDPAVFTADLDPVSTTSPIDLDSDDDGIADGVEDANGDGAANHGETMAHQADSDLDGLFDGLELGLEYGTADTDGRVFMSDDDPLTTTDPLNADSDGGGVPDGVEDHDRNGAVDTWDTDPNDTHDEALAVYFSGILPGGTVHLEVWNATPFETIIPAYSLKGPGPTPIGLGINVDLSHPIAQLPRFSADSAGRASQDQVSVPANAPLGIFVWMQAIEVSLGGSTTPRKSNPVKVPIGAI